MTTEQINKVLAQETFNTLGVELSGVIVADEYRVVHTGLAINPAMCGPVGAMFSKIDCKVLAAIAGETLHVDYHYTYEHSNGGRNGYRVSRQIKLS